jgi:hypothetical protein
VAKLGESGELSKCSLCGRGQTQVRRLIAGPGVYICDGCVDFCCEIMDVEGLPPPRRYDARFDLEAVLGDWVDRIAHRGTGRVDEAREFLEGLLRRIQPQHAHEDP